jgi:hypothetical protein
VALHKWIDIRQHIRAFDPDQQIVTLSSNIAQWIKEPDARYYIENAPDALDQPGEWYLDPSSGRLTYWPLPGQDLARADVVAPQLASELVRFEGDFAARRPVRHVVLRGLTLAHTDWEMGPDGHSDIQAAVGIRGDVLAEGAVECRIEDCTLAHLGGYALEIGRGCQRMTIVGNEIYDIGGGGVRIGETAKQGDPFELNHGHRVTDNHLHQLGRVFAPAVGVIIFQSGQNRVAHNHIHDLYYTAISVGWNWGYQETPCRENIIESNHLHHVGQGMLSDMGGIYTLGIQKGTVLRNNLIHDVVSHDYGGWGLYTDEGSTDILLENNVVYHCKSAGFHQHYGRDNLIRNNVFALNRECQLMRTREESHHSFRFERNIVYFDSGVLLGSNWSNDRFIMDFNVYYDVRLGAFQTGLRFKDASLIPWRLRGHDPHSLLVNPRFRDVERLDFRLHPSSPARAVGFQPIDLSEVGVRKPSRRE